MIRKLFKGGLILYTKQKLSQDEKATKTASFDVTVFSELALQQGTTLTLRHFGAFVRDFSHLCEGRYM